MTDYRLSELLDMAIIQKLADSNFHASGLPMSIIDALDGSVLVQAGWQDVCTRFHRAHPLSAERCRQSDIAMTDRLREGEFYRYRCKNGLNHFATPIVVAGQTSGNDVPDPVFLRGGNPGPGAASSARRANSATIPRVILRRLTDCRFSASKR